MDLLILFALIVINGLFAMSELAVVSSKKARLRARADRGDRGAEAALSLQDDPSSFLSTVQIGITLTGIIAGAYGATALSDDLAPWIAVHLPAFEHESTEIAFALVIVLTTYLSLVVGELVPKRIALVAPEAIAGLVAAPMSVLAKIAYPAVWLLRASTEGVLRLLHLADRKTEAVTEEEIHAIIEEGASSGALEQEERTMMRGVMRLADRSVRSIMTPRPDVVWIDADAPIASAVRKMAESGHSQFPLVRGDLEHVVGVLQAKDLLASDVKERGFDLAAAARAATFVPETLSVMKLLEAMQGGEARMALVVDEHGVVLGLVTAADLLGAIAGAGAFSEGRWFGASRSSAGDGCWLVDGLTPIQDLAVLLNAPELDAGESGYTTIAGLVMYRLQRLPALGDSVEAGRWRFEVIDMDGRRIDKILIEPANR